MLVATTKAKKIRAEFSIRLQASSCDRFRSYSIPRGHSSIRIKRISLILASRRLSLFTMALDPKSWPKWIWDQPTIPAPPGVTPNLVNPYTMHPYNVLTQSVCLTIATLLVWIRIYTKKFVLDGLGWEDCGSRAFAFFGTHADPILQVLPLLPG
jgi:hypothetical protein